MHAYCFYWFSTCNVKCSIESYYMYGLYMCSGFEYFAGRKMIWIDSKAHICIGVASMQMIIINWQLTKLGDFTNLGLQYENELVSQPGEEMDIYTAKFPTTGQWTE